MADDGLIKIGTSVDISGIQSGMQQAQEAVKAATANMQSAYEALGKSAALGNTQATETLKAYGAELQQAQQRLASVTQATTSLATAERSESTALQSSVSARMAASAELRIFEGNIQGSTRAAGALLASLPGLGSAMQLAFPVFGAVALIGVVDTLGKKMYEAFDLGGERARKTQEDIRNLSLEIDRSTTSLNVQIDKLQQEQARLEHKPFNGIKLVLDEAAESANKLAEQLDQVAARQKKVIEGMAASGPQQLFGKTGTGYEQTMIQQHAKWIGLAKTTQDQLNESMSYGNSLQTRLNDLKAKQAAADQAAESSSGETGIVTDYQNEIDAVQQLISWQRQEQANIRATVALNEQQASTQRARDAHGSSVIDNSAQVAQMRAIESEYEKLNAAKAQYNGKGLSAGDGASFWAQYLTTFKSGSEEAKHVLEEYVKSVDENHKKLQSSIAAYAKQQTQNFELPPSMEALDKWFRDQADDVTRTGDRWREYNEQVDRGVAIQIRAAESIALANISAAQASGAITKLGADHQIAAIHAADYAAQIAALSAELAKLKSEATIDPKTGLADPKNAAQQQQVQNQITQVKGQAQTSGINDQAAIQQQIAQPYLTAFNQINQGWLEVQNRMLFSTRNLGAAFAKMGQTLFISIVDNAERAALISIEKDAAMSISHQVSVANQVSTTATGAAATTAIKQSENLKQMMQDAKAAAVAGWKAGMQFPFPTDIVMAPLLAGIGLSGALAQFEDGTGFVPRDGMAYLHQGEAVVPAPTMDELRGSDGSSGLTIHNTTNITSHAERDVIRAIQRNPHEIAGALRKHMRQAGRI